MLTILDGTKTSTARFPAALMTQAVQIIGLVPKSDAISRRDRFQLDPVRKSNRVDFSLTRDPGPVSREPRKYLGTANPFLVHLYTLVHEECRATL